MPDSGCRRTSAGYGCGHRLADGWDRKSVVQGKSVDLGGRRIIKKKIFYVYMHDFTYASYSCYFEFRDLPSRDPAFHTFYTHLRCPAFT